MMNSSFKQIAKKIKKAKSVAIFTHVNPDCDALGSSLPLALAIRSLNIKADVYVKDEFTYSKSLVFDKNTVKNGHCNPNDYDLMISTDVPSISRLGEYGEIFASFENRVVLDHHPNVNTLGKVYYVDTRFSSCSEISFLVIKALKANITKEIASYLYAGLSADTYSFMNANVNENSLKIALELLKNGADVNDINEKLYKTKTDKEVKLMSYMWKNYVIDNDIVYCLVDLQTLEKIKAQKSDCDNFSSELLCIDTVKCSFSIVELEKGLYNLSLRGKNNENVMSIAQKLGGGGHLRAAGAKFKAEDIYQARDMVLNAFKEFKGN